MKPKQILTIVLIVAAGIYFTINARKEMNTIENNYQEISASKNVDQSNIQWKLIESIIMLISNFGQRM